MFQTSDQRLNVYKNAVVRIQFPDGMILQGVFQPTNTIQDINNFVKEHLKTPDKQFLICKLGLKIPHNDLLFDSFIVKFFTNLFSFCFSITVTTPLKDTLDPKTTLLQAKFVPCVHMHFKWTEEGIASYLNDDIYTKKTSSDAASILASRYRLVLKTWTCLSGSTHRKWRGLASRSGKLGTVGMPAPCLV